MILAALSLPPGTWLLGISGGGDSLALARLLQQAGASVAWGHFNHRWSAWGEEAEVFVRAQAARYGATLHVGHGAGKAASNAEAQARDERLAFFRETCAAHGYAGVILAHTQTDVAETFLLRAGKGSGVRGLAAMAADSELYGLRILRPLLDVSREDLRAWLQEQGQDWLDDPDTANQRAKVRALLPQLAAAGIPVHGLAAAAQAAGRAQVALAGQVQQVWNRQEAMLALAALQGLPEEIGAQLLGEIIHTNQPGPVVRTSKRLALLARLQTEPTGKATLGGLTWQWRDGMLTWQRG